MSVRSAQTAVPLSTSGRKCSTYSRPLEQRPLDLAQLPGLQPEGVRHPGAQLAVGPDRYELWLVMTAEALLAGPAPRQLVAGLASGDLWETHDAGETWNPPCSRFPRIERSLVRLES
jgi:hypothetical protein